MQINLKKPVTKTVGIRLDEKDYVLMVEIAKKNDISVAFACRAIFMSGFNTMDRESLLKNNK